MSIHPYYVFFGSPHFARIVLETLIQNRLPPFLVVTNPDRPFGRKKGITPPPAKIAAQKAGISVLQPENIHSQKLTDALKMADFAVVAAYAHILPSWILELPKMGFLGVHPSILPKYRGASPIQSAILAGEKKTGVVIYRVDEKMDHGPILAQQELNREMSTINYEEASDALARIGGELLVATLPSFMRGDITLKPQSHDDATFTKKCTADDAFIDHEELQAALSGNTTAAAKIDRMIRALNPEPGAWTKCNNEYRTPNLGRFPAKKRIKLLEAEIKDKILVLKKIQVEGKKPRASLQHSSIL